MQHFFGLVSALIVLLSYPIYGYRIYRKEIETNIATWFMFVLISVSLFLSYHSSGAQENALVTYGGVLGTISILLLSLFRGKKPKFTFLSANLLGLTLCLIGVEFIFPEYSEYNKYPLTIFGGIFILNFLGSMFTKIDWICVGIAIVSMVLWYITKDDKELAQFALYVALFADLIAIIPTIVFLRKNPKKDRPAMWIIFSLGYFLSIFAITEHTIANYSLPLFMVIVPAFVWWPLVKYRWQNKIPLTQWI